MNATEQSSRGIEKPSFKLAPIVIALSAATGSPNAVSQPETVEPSRTLEEVVVLAQKRSQLIQDVPIAATALAGDSLRQRNITETTDLAAVVPNLQIMTPYGRTQPNFSMRGISVANEFSATTASPIGVYVDEVYMSLRATHGQQLYDLERIEALRGPQGTLYGRNTTGGAISFFTKQPSLEDNNGDLTLGYGNYNTTTATGAYEATLVPGVFGVRIAGTYIEGDGFIENPLLGEATGSNDSVAGRVSFRWTPSDRLDVGLKLFFAEDNPIAAAPYAEGQLEDSTDALGYSRFAPQPALGGRLLTRDEVITDTLTEIKVESTGFALRVNYDLSDSITLTSITGFDDSSYRNLPADCDGSPNLLCSQSYRSDSENFNQELRLVFQGEKLNLVTGLYAGRDTVDTVNDQNIFGAIGPILEAAGLPPSYANPPIFADEALAVVPAFAAVPGLDPADPASCAPVLINPNGYVDGRSLLALLTDAQLTNSSGGGFGGAISEACRQAGAPPVSPLDVDQSFTLTRPSMAMFADATYDLTESTTLSAGIRYTSESVEYERGLAVANDLGGQPFAGTIPFSFPYQPGLPGLSQKEDEDQLTGRVNLSHQFNDDVMGYVNFSRGYRSGNFNGFAALSESQVYYAEPEEIDAYEAGIKSSLANGKLRINAAAFFYDFKNHQVQEVEGVTTLIRTADGELYGGEVEINALITDWLRLDLAAGFVESEYKGNTFNPDDPSSLSSDVNGNPFPFAAEQTLSAGLDVDLYSGDAGQLTSRVEANYMGEHFYDPFASYGQTPCDAPPAGSVVLAAGPSIACGNPGYWLVNARLDYRYRNWALSLWGKNLADRFYYNYGINLSTIFLDYLNRGLPRTYGMELRYEF